MLIICNQMIPDKKDITPAFEDFVLDMVKDIHETDIEYIYRGIINSEIVANTLELAKVNIEKTVEIIPMRHRIYFIMGEGLQNITKHQDRPKQEDLADNSLIYISKKDDKYNITTANIISNKNISILKEKLDQINELSLSELRQLAREIRKNNVLDDNSNASIGLVEIAKRSGRKLLYEFRKIDDEYSYFYLNIEINISYIQKSEKLESQDRVLIDYLVKFHDFLNEIDSRLIFKGDFSQDNILSLLEMLKHQIPESTVSIKINNIMIEMLQNIEKHGENIEGNKNWKPGFFMINFSDGKFFLTSANYINNKKIDSLTEKISSLNKMNKEKLSQLYKQKLLEIDSITAQKTGLGFIDIRRRSNNPFNYSFLPINENFSLFIFQVMINS